MKQFSVDLRERLLGAISAGLAAITAVDARAWFAHCGYPVLSRLL